MHLFCLISKAHRSFALILITVVGLIGYWIIFQNRNHKDEDLKLSVESPILKRGILLNPRVFEKNHQNDTELTERFPKYIYNLQPSMLSDDSNGRLGNRMFMYATLFALSQYNHRPAFMSPGMSDYILKYFKVSLSTLNQSLYRSIEWSWMEVTGNVHGDCSIRNITKPFVIIHGTGGGQSWKYFDEIRPQILKEFRFHDHIVKSTKSLLRDIRNEFMGAGSDGDERSKVKVNHAAIMIGIHVRRGDYVEFARELNFYLPGVKFYEGAMGYLQAKYGNRNDHNQSVIFVVASDEKEWCEQNLLVLPNFQIHILKEAPEDMPGLDLAILSSCDHVIFGLGTFGFWVGYLNLGEVVYCSTCFTPTSVYLQPSGPYNGDYRNFILPRWTGFSRDGNKTDYSVLAKATVLT